MALIDEGKLQGNIYNILDVLRKDITCCKYIQGSWMCDSGAANPVWVLINDKGTVTTLDGPQGSPVTVLGTLGPLNSAGQCPTPPLVPVITALAVEQILPCDILITPDQTIGLSFTTNIPLGAYQLQAYVSSVWTDCATLIPFVGPGTYSAGPVLITPYQNLEGNVAFRVIEVNTGAIGGPIVSTFVTCVP